MDGRTDGRTDSAGPARPGAGAQAGRAGGDLGVSAGCPLPTARPGPPWPPRGRLFGDSFLFLVPPRPLARRGGCSCWTDTDGCWEALTPTRLWQRRQRGSETPPSPGKCEPRSPPRTGPPGRVCWVLRALVGFPTHLHPPLSAPSPFWAASSCPGCCPTKHQSGDPVGSSVWGGWSLGCGVQDPGCARAEGVWDAPDP